MEPWHPDVWIFVNLWDDDDTSKHEQHACSCIVFQKRSFLEIFSDSLSFNLKIGILDENVMSARYQCPYHRLFATSYFSVINSMAFFSFKNGWNYLQSLFIYGGSLVISIITFFQNIYWTSCNYHDHHHDLSRNQSIIFLNHINQCYRSDVCLLFFMLLFDRYFIGWYHISYSQ